MLRRPLTPGPALLGDLSTEGKASTDRVTTISRGGPLPAVSVQNRLIFSPCDWLLQNNAEQPLFVETPQIGSQWFSLANKRITTGK